MPAPIVDRLYVYLYFRPERELRIEFPKPDQARAYFDQIETKKEGARMSSDRCVDFKLPSMVQKVESSQPLEGFIFSFETDMSANDWKDAICTGVAGRPDVVTVNQYWLPGRLDLALGITSLDNRSRDHNGENGSLPSRRDDPQGPLEPPLPPGPPYRPPEVRRRSTYLPGPDVNHRQVPEREREERYFVRDRDRDYSLDNDSEYIEARYRGWDRDREPVVQYVSPPPPPIGSRREEDYLDNRIRDRGLVRLRDTYESPPGTARPSRRRPVPFYDSASSSGDDSRPPRARGSRFQSERDKKRHWWQF